MAIVASAHQLEPPEIDGAAWAHADPLRTRQILRNLITNARRYGGSSIRLVIAPDASFARVSVVDDGPGVPAAQAVAIFEPYRSAHDQRGQPGSVGLGCRCRDRWPG
jgi:signal transduction histidine kinase